MTYKRLFTIIFSLLLITNQAQASFDLNDSWIGEPFSKLTKNRAVKGKKYMISTADKHASEAGSWALEQGGNAIDAAIAAQLVLNVVEPHSSGIGGGGFLLYFNAKTKTSNYYNGREKAPSHAYSTMFLDKNGNPRKFNDAVRGGLSVGVPGLLKILKQAHDKHGKLPWAKLFDPAIKIASQGFKIDERLYLLAKKISYLNDFPESKELYLNQNSKPHQPGTLLTNKKLAKTFKILANQGIKPFYSGKIAKNIVSTVQNSPINPGLLTMADMRNYKSKIGNLICAKYRQYKICSMPLPSSGGVTILQILGILQHFDLTKMSQAQRVHTILEASKLAYADRNRYVGDVKNVPIKQMLDEKYLKHRATLINPRRALKNVKAGKFHGKFALLNNNRELPSTTHLSIIDQEGNSVALTSSIEYYFGSGITVDGFTLNNQLTDFSFKPIINGHKVANRVQPNKQPRSSMSPAFVFDQNDNLIMTIGSPGGPRIIQFVVKTIINHLDLDQNIQKSISSPNFIALNEIVELEKNTKIAKIAPDLEKLGHKIKIIPITSGINAIAINNNKIQGGADPRRQGKAIGK